MTAIAQSTKCAIHTIVNDLKHDASKGHEGFSVGISNISGRQKTACSQKHIMVQLLLQAWF